jgi:hypothetical protein
MSAQRNLRTYTKALTAGQSINIDVAGDMFAVLKSTSRFTIEFDESNVLREVPEGASSIFSNTYQKVTLKSDATQTVTLVLGFGQFDMSNSTQVASVTAAIAVPNSSQFLSASVDTQIQLQPVDTDRQEIVISVPSNAPNGIRITDVTTASRTTGFLLEEGQTITIAGTSQIRVCSAVAAVAIDITYIVQKVV